MGHPLYGLGGRGQKPGPPAQPFCKRISLALLHAIGMTMLGPGPRVEPGNSCWMFATDSEGLFVVHAFPFPPFASQRTGHPGFYCGKRESKTAEGSATRPLLARMGRERSRAWATRRDSHCNRNSMGTRS